MTNLSPIPPYRPPGELREKLTAMRDAMMDRMRRRGQVEPGHLPMIAGIAAALQALNDNAGEAAPVARASVDDDGEVIKLTIYGIDGAAIATTALTPARALTLAGNLLDAAGTRLADDLAELRSQR